MSSNTERKGEPDMGRDDTDVDDTYDTDEPDEPLAEEFEGLPVTGYDDAVDQPDQGDRQDDASPAPAPGDRQVDQVGWDDDETGADDPDPDDTAETSVAGDPQDDEQGGER